MAPVLCFIIKRISSKSVVYPIYIYHEIDCTSIIRYCMKSVKHLFVSLFIDYILALESECYSSSAISPSHKIVHDCIFHAFSKYLKSV